MCCPAAAPKRSDAEQPAFSPRQPPSKPLLPWEKGVGMRGRNLSAQNYVSGATPLRLPLNPREIRYLVDRVAHSFEKRQSISPEVFIRNVHGDVVQERIDRHAQF